MILFMRESSRFSFRRANIERRRSISSSFSPAIGECFSKHYMPLLACRMFNPAVVVNLTGSSERWDLLVWRNAVARANCDADQAPRLALECSRP